MRLLSVLVSVCTVVCWVGMGSAHAANWVPPQEYQIKYPLNIAGTLQRGVSNVTEPKPVKSRFFQVVVGGVSLDETGARLVLKVNRIAALPEHAVVKVEYPNPQHPQQPLIEEVPCDPAESTYVFVSPQVIWGLQGYYSHKVKVAVYEQQGDEKPLDTLEQNIRSYVDTQDPSRILIFKKILDAAGISRSK